ncbi:uncharacterized protein LOC143254590 [Tachypleus tridentatus]|uniref:uncharacterized protein LOC143254590 n=1 Tax=Tachypleus tridentatus TaxID=6853 RepID=UPI003FD63B0C
MMLSKKSGSKTKPKELVSDTSILERKGLHTFQMSFSSKRKENNTLKGKSDLFSAKNTSSSKSVSISKKQPQKIRETNRPVKPPCFPHVTSVINTVAKGDLSCSNICSNSITRRRSDETTSSLVEFDNKTTVKMDSPKLLCIKDTFEACNEVKENAKPCIFVSIGLALITRVPAHPPGKFIQQDSVRDSPRIHLKEIKQDSNRSNDSLNPTCDTLSSVKRKITNSLRQLPCKRKAEENRGERRMVLSPAGSGATGKRRKKEVDIMWNCTPTPKSPGYCDSQNNCSVSSYFSHQSSLNINSWSHNDDKEQCTKHKPKGEVNSTSEAPVSHSSDKNLKERKETRDEIKRNKKKHG